MKPLVGLTVAPKAADYGLSLRIAENYAAAFRRIGFDTLVLPVDRTNLASVERLLQPDIRLIFSHGGWMMSPSGPLRDNIARALRAADKPMIVLIADPPFSPWLPPIFANLPPRAVPFFIDPSFAIGTTHWIPSGVHAAYLPSIHLMDGHGPARDSEKTIPLLFVGALAEIDVLYNQARRNTALLRMFEALVDSTLYEPAVPLMLAAQHVLPVLGIPFDMDQPDLREALNLADKFIRYARRNTLVNRLVHHPTLFVAPITGLPERRHPDVAVIPPQPFPRMLELLRQSRATVICQPHFPGALNERIVWAMQARCAVITTPNPRTGQLFGDGEHALFTAPRYANIDELIARVGNQQETEAMREAALSAVYARHTPDQTLRHMLDVLRTRGLLDPDLPGTDGERLEVPPLTWPAA